MAQALKQGPGIKSLASKAEYFMRHKRAALDNGVTIVVLDPARDITSNEFRDWLDRQPELGYKRHGLVFKITDERHPKIREAAREAAREAMRKARQGRRKVA